MKAEITNPEILNSKVRALVSVELPVRLLQAFLQHLRDFDSAHFADTEFTLSVDCKQLSVEETQGILRSINPPFAHEVLLKKEGN